MNDIETIQAKQVLTALVQFESKIAEISNFLENKSQLSGEEKKLLQNKLSALKTELKAAAKQGTVSGKKEPQDSFEQCFFKPAVSSALLSLRVSTNSHPINSKWLNFLEEATREISYLRHQLEGQFQDG